MEVDNVGVRGGGNDCWPRKYFSKGNSMKFRRIQSVLSPRFTPPRRRKFW